MSYMGFVESGEDSLPDERKESLLVPGEKELSPSLGEEKKDYSTLDGRAGEGLAWLGGLVLRGWGGVI